MCGSIFEVVSLVPNILLMIGAMKRIHYLLKPYLWFTGMKLALWFISSFIGILALSIIVSGYILILFPVVAVTWGASAYLFSVVLSHYKELRDEGNTNALELNAPNPHPAI